MVDLSIAMLNYQRVYESLFMNGWMTIPRDRQITSNYPSFDRSTHVPESNRAEEKMNDI